VRWTLPRLRIDQVMMTCLKYLLPISCFLLLGVSVWEVAVRPVIGPYFAYVLSLLCVAGLAFLIFKLVTTPSKLPFAGVTPGWPAAAPPRTDVAARP